MKLKILTQNLHCFAEDKITENQKRLAEFILSRDIDIIFLQEVAQLPTNKSRVNEDNYALKVLKHLSKSGKQYQLYYKPIKMSFTIYEEGVAILSKYPLLEVDGVPISKTQDYQNWKSREVLFGILQESGKRVAVATTHFGWSDGYEVFEEQFDNAVKAMPKADIKIFAGDFNITPNTKEYRYITSIGWNDIFATVPFGKEPTFRGDESTNGEPVRIDYVMTNQPVQVVSSQVCFVDERISDHLGVYTEIELFE